MVNKVRGVLFGASGLAGSGIKRALSQKGVVFDCPNSKLVNLLSESQVRSYLHSLKPTFIVLAAGVVGGIHENINKQSSFLIENFEMNKNVLQIASELKIENLLMLASSCIYPVSAPQPLRESDFYHGAPESTNSGHAIGKKAACWLLQCYRESLGLNWTTVISSSLYGIEDDFSGNGHVIPGLINRFKAAVQLRQPAIPVWGEPTTEREFLYNHDLGEAVSYILDIRERPTLLNVGSGETVNLRMLAELIADKFHYDGEISFDISRPSGWARRAVDSTQIKEFGWTTKTFLNEGLDEIIKFRNSA